MKTTDFNLQPLIYSLGIFGVVILASGLYFLSPTHAQNENDSLYSVDSSPFGKPYKFWTQKWWEWNLSFNASNHPNNNYTDEKCARGQKADSPVWFLVQPWPKPDANFERTCTIPSGKAVITATQSGDCNYGVLETKTDEELLKCAKIGNDYTLVEVTVDNKTYKNYEKGNRVTSDFFNATIIPGNTMDYQNIGKFRAAVDGYYIFLKPLTPGKHVVHYKFSTSPPLGPLQEYKSNQEGTWNLIAK